MRSDRDKIIFEAEFDEKLKTYFFVGMLLLFLVTLAGILLIPFAVVLTLVFLLMPLIALVYGVVGAVRSSNGAASRSVTAPSASRTSGGTLTGCSPTPAS